MTTQLPSIDIDRRFLPPRVWPYIVPTILRNYKADRDDGVVPIKRCHTAALWNLYLLNNSMAALHAGIPYTAGLNLVNRQYSESVLKWAQWCQPDCERDHDWPD